MSSRLVKTAVRGACLCQFLLVIALAGCTACSGWSRDCYIEFPVFDPEGNRRAFDIVSVSPAEEDYVNLLKLKVEGLRIEAKRDRLYFGEAIVGWRPLLVELENENQRRVSTVFYSFDCRQRVSLRYGHSETGADSAWTKVYGRLSGCAIEGDWRVRAASMFGNYAGGESDHSFISTEDGSFRIIARGGFRRVVTIGDGRRVVKSVEADVIDGTLNDVGVIDLSQYCPD